MLIREKTVYHSRCDQWFDQKIQRATNREESLNKLFYTAQWHLASFFLYGYDLTIPRLSWYLLPLKPSNQMGDLNLFPYEVIRRISDYLCIEEIQSFRKICHQCREFLPKEYCKSFFRQRIVLPIEAFGDLERSCAIIPMPQTMKKFLWNRVFDDPSTHYIPILRAYYFEVTGEDGKKEEVPATYQGIQKAAELKKSDCLRMIHISDKILLSEKAPKRKEMHWMLITSEVLWGSKELGYQKTIDFLQKWSKEHPCRKGFQMPLEIRDVFYTMLYQNCVDFKIYYKNEFTYCKESLNSKSHLVIGYSGNMSGVAVDVNYYYHPMFVQYTGSVACKYF